MISVSVSKRFVLFPGLEDHLFCFHSTVVTHGLEDNRRDSRIRRRFRSIMETLVQESTR